MTDSDGGICVAANAGDGVITTGTDTITIGAGALTGGAAGGASGTRTDGAKDSAVAVVIRA